MRLRLGGQRWFLRLSILMKRLILQASKFSRSQKLSGIDRTVSITYSPDLKSPLPKQLPSTQEVTPMSSRQLTFGSKWDCFIVFANCTNKPQPPSLRTVRTNSHEV